MTANCQVTRNLSGMRNVMIVRISRISTSTWERDMDLPLYKSENDRCSPDKEELPLTPNHLIQIFSVVDEEGMIGSIYQS